MSFGKFFEKNQEQFLEALKDGSIKIDEAVESVVTKRKSRGCEIILYELLSACKKRNYDNFKVLLPLLKTDNEHCREMVFKEHVHFEFPVINNNQAEMARGIVVETKRLFTNVHNVFSHIEKFSKIVGKNFSVLFDRDIVEDSFMLPLYIALSFKDYDRRWVFTGGLEENLGIKQSDFLEEKEKVCKSLGKILLSAREFSNARQIVEFLSFERYNVPFVISFTDKRDEEYLKRSYEKLCKKVERPLCEKIFFKIFGKSATYSQKALTREDFLIQVQRVFQILSEIVSFNGIPHLSLICPSSFAMGLGIMYGWQNSIVLYHYQNDEYHAVLDLRNSTRTIKKVKDAACFEKIYFEEIGEGSDCALVIQFASHSPVGDAERFIREKKIDAKIVRIFHRELGGIPLGDWSEEIVELMSLLQFLKRKHGFERFHFFLSLPVPVAFGFGMALGHFVKGSIYQFTSKSDESYFEALKIEQLAF